MFFVNLYKLYQVHQAFTLPISFFCDKSNVGYTRFRYELNKQNKTYITPVYKSQPDVWGLTAYIVDTALGVLVPEKYKSVSFFR